MAMKESWRDIEREREGGRKGGREIGIVDCLHLFECSINKEIFD